MEQRGLSPDGRGGPMELASRPTQRRDVPLCECSVTADPKGWFNLGTSTSGMVESDCVKTIQQSGV